MIASVNSVHKFHEVAVPESITASQIARLAGVSRSAVSNWRRRHADFPPPISEGPGAAPLFDRAQVEDWLRARGLPAHPTQPDDALRLALADATAHRPGDDGLAVALAALAGTPISDEIPTDRALRAAALAIPPAERAQAGERLLRAQRGGRRRAAEHESDDDLARFIVSVAGPVAGTVVDPAVGFGTLLLTAAAAATGDLDPRGSDIDPRATAIATARLALHGIDAHIETVDVLRSPPGAGGYADLVLCDPPLGVRLPPDALPSSDPRWAIAHPGNSGDLAWLVQAAWLVRPPAGRALVVGPRSVAFRGGAVARARAALLARGLVEAVIELPPGAGGRTTRVPLLLWVLRSSTHSDAPERVLLARVADLDDGPRMRALLDRIRHDERADAAAPNVRPVDIATLVAADAQLDPAHWLQSSATDHDARVASAWATLAAADRRLRALRSPRPPTGGGERDGARERLAVYGERLNAVQRAMADLHALLEQPPGTERP